VGKLSGIRDELHEDTALLLERYGIM